MKVTLRVIIFSTSPKIKKSWLCLNHFEIISKLVFSNFFINSSSKILELWNPFSTHITLFFYGKFWRAAKNMKKRRTCMKSGSMKDDIVWQTRSFFFNQVFDPVRQWSYLNLTDRVFSFFFFKHIFDPKPGLPTLRIFP